MSKRGQEIKSVDVPATKRENIALGALYAAAIPGYIVAMTVCRKKFEDKLLEGQEGLLDEAGVLNYGKTPAAFYMTLGAFAGPPVAVYAGKSLFNVFKGVGEFFYDAGPAVMRAIQKCRKKEPEAQPPEDFGSTLPLVTTDTVQVHPKIYKDGWAGAQRWKDFGLNVVTLHTPKAFAITTFLLTSIEAGTFTIAVDIWERTKEEDFQKAAELALKTGEKLAGSNPTLAAFAGLTLLIILRKQHALVESPRAQPAGKCCGLFDKVGQAADHLFVDHTLTVTGLSTSV